MRKVIENVWWIKVMQDIVIMHHQPARMKLQRTPLHHNVSSHGSEEIIDWRVQFLSLCKQFSMWFGLSWAHILPCGPDTVSSVLLRGIKRQLDNFHRCCDAGFSSPLHHPSGLLAHPLPRARVFGEIAHLYGVGGGIDQPAVWSEEDLSMPFLDGHHGWLGHGWCEIGCLRIPRESVVISHGSFQNRLCCYRWWWCNTGSWSAWVAPCPFGWGEDTGYSAQQTSRLGRHTINPLLFVWGSRIL